MQKWVRPDMGGLGFKQLSAASVSSLDMEVFMEELREAVWGCDGSKAPEPDGFNFIFYKKDWHLFGEEIFYMVSKFFSQGLCQRASTAPTLL